MLPEMIVDKIKEYIDTLTPRFGGDARIAIVRRKTGSEPVKLGTYGMIKNASTFMVSIHDEAEGAQLSAAYMFEQAVLYCTQLHVGSCWMAMFNKGDFDKQVVLRGGEKVAHIAPIGFKAEQTRFINNMMRKLIKADQRKGFDTLFFENDSTHALTEASAGVYGTPLEMLRLAPSSSNKQPWRAIVTDDAIHFYLAKGVGASETDMGIAFCHFELTCRELGIAGDYAKLADAPAFGGDCAYILSWKKG